MRIHININFKGSSGEVMGEALVDTGAEVSIIPLDLARQVGASHTNQDVNLIGIHGQSRRLPIGMINIFFPSLNNIGANFPVAVSDVEREPIIGMDILKPLGISIDTKTQQLSVKNEIWEAFKTLATAGVLIYAGIKILESIFEEK